MPSNGCPSPEQLEGLLEEQLDDTSCLTVAAHVGACPLCQAALERLTEDETGDSVRRSNSRSPDAGPAPFLARLKQVPPHADEAALAATSSASGLPAVPGYEILSVLGRGGMGVVYKARQVGLNRLVALKMILSGSHVGPKGLTRFLAEAEAVARLRHPNIVQIYDIGEASGSPYFALEFVDSGSLARRLGGDPQPLESAGRLVETLARAIHFAHQQGIVHRDLKPANVLLAGIHDEAPGSPPVGSSPLTPKIADFGLAKRLDEKSTGTQTGEVVGTPSYMAPEQAAGKARLIGPATDVYALGAILYELLTGRPPFKGAAPLDTVVQVLHEEPVRPTRLRPQLPRDLEIICLKCLEKEPHRRYASAEALADDLRCFRQGKPILARPVGRIERAAKWARRRPLSAALLAGMILVTVLGFTGVTWQWQEARAARDVAVEERKKARAALYYSRISQSQLQWRVNDVTGSRHSLEKCVPSEGFEDRRGWEWYYLRGLFHTDLFTLRHRHAGVGGALAFRPDGRWLASVVGAHPEGDGEQAGEVRIWEAASGRLVRDLIAPGTAHRLAFAPDGERLALACTDGTLLVWDAAAGKELVRQRHHTQLAAGVAFSPDGRHLASAGWDGTVKVCNSSTGRVLHTLTRHTGRVQSVAYHPNGERLASGGWDMTVRLWDALTGREIEPPLFGHNSPVCAVAFSPDGRLLASAGSNGNLKIWDVATAKVVQSLTGHTGALLGLAFSPDGRYLAYGGGDATVRVWDVENGVERFIFRGHTAPVESVQFSPDGRRLASSSPTEMAAVKVWDLTRHPEFGTFARIRGRGQDAIDVWDLTRRPDSPAPAQTGPDIEALGFQPTGNRLISVTVGGAVQTWDAATGVLLSQLVVPMSAELVSPAVLAAFSPGGELLAARAREDNRLVRVWDVATGAEVNTLHGHTLPVFCVRFSADGHRLATCGWDNAAPDQPHEVRVWDARDGKLLAALPGRGRVVSAAWAPDGKRLALGGQDGTVSLVDWSAARPTVRLAEHKGLVGAVAFSPDGELLASAGLEDRTVHLWDLKRTAASPRKRLRALRTLTGPGFLCDLAFSPDGRRLAGVSRDVVKMWDVGTGHEVLTLRGAPQRHWDPAFNPRVLFSPDGKRLVATNWDETISIWEADQLDDAGAMARRQAARRRAADTRASFWHVQEAESCLEHNNRSAARFHLDRVGDAARSEALQRRRDRLVQQFNNPAKKGK